MPDLFRQVKKVLLTENIQAGDAAQMRLRVERVVRALATELAAGRVADSSSFWSGPGGQALTLACCSRLGGQGSAHWAEVAQERILAVVDELAPLSERSLLSHTWSLWAARAIHAHFPANAELLNLCEEYDECLLQACDECDVSDFSFDVINGWSAMLAYALWAWHAARRRGLPADGSLHLAQRALQGLMQMATDSPAAAGGQYWHWYSQYPHCRSHSMRNNPYGYFDYGVAHGNFGVAAALALCQHSPLQAGAEPVMQGLLAWLASRQNQAACASLYAYGSANANSESRCAWCYGDAGISWVLAQVGRQYGQAEWQRLGLQAAKLCVQRPPRQRGIVDGGLCHGHAGLAHILARHARATPDACSSAWRQCVDSHMLSTLEILEAGSEEEYGYLEGRSGMALTLASYYLGLEDSWDFPLLLSLPT